MLMTIDVGNTNTVFGMFVQADEIFELRVKTDPSRTIDEYIATLESLLSRKFKQGYQVTGAIISSVVPPVTPDLVAVCESYWGVKPLVVGPGIKTGLPVKLTDPSAVGADRIVNAVAVKNLFGCPAFAVDVGTATTIDFVNMKGEYEGGAIIPGPRTASEALVRSTAKLPRIEYAWPSSLIGKNTVHAMQVGAVVGYAKMIDGLLSAMMQEVGNVKHIVATGGLGKIFAAHSNCITSYDPALTLKGMKILWELNRG